MMGDGVIWLLFCAPCLVSLQGMAEYKIAELPLAGGFLGIGPMPGRSGAFEGDLNAILRWGAGMVVTMNPMRELQRCGADALGADLAAAGVVWQHLPVADFGAPDARVAALWEVAARDALALLKEGARVFTHCYGGCGRAGMAALRLMVESGEDAPAALQRLRSVRPCVVQTDAQYAWAAKCR